MENMTSYHSINKVVAGEDRVNFIYQYVKDSYGWVKEYNCKNTRSIIKTYERIIGPPTNFPNYGDFLSTFVMRTNGFDISTSPWQKPITSSNDNLPQDNSHMYCNYLDLEFQEAVYPVRVSMYEVYNPGYVTEIWAQGKQQYPDDIIFTKKKHWENNQWFLLWSGPPQNAVPLTSRIFSPPLSFCDFKTKKLRLQFMYSHWNYSTHLDAVELIGTSELVLPKSPKLNLTNLLKNINCKYPCHGDSHNLTPDHEAAHSDIVHLQENFSKYCVICKSNTAKSFNKSKFGHKQMSQEIDMARAKQRYRNPFIERGIYGNNHLLRHPHLLHYPNYAKLIKDIELCSNESKEQSICSSFSTLPNEIVLIIFENLDMKSLCRMRQVNTRFNMLTRDPLLFKCLNLRNLRYTKSLCIHNVLLYFAFTCKYLQRLDLTASNISVGHFKKFVNICGKGLTHLRLSNCPFVDNSVLLKISITCKMLKVLDLSFCYHPKYEPLEFSCLENLEFLEDLNLRYMVRYIATETLCKILQKNRRMRNLNLRSLDGPIFNRSDEDQDAVAIQLGNSCPDLEIIDLTGCVITSRGIEALAECKNLRQLNISYTDDFGTLNICGTDQLSLRKLFSSCQLLEEVNLLGLKGNFDEPLTLCKNLKQIYLDVPTEYLPENADSLAIFEQCPKLQTIYLQYPYSYMKNGNFVAQAKEKYPHLSIYEYKW